LTRGETYSDNNNVVIRELSECYWGTCVHCNAHLRDILSLDC